MPDARMESPRCTATSKRTHKRCGAPCRRRPEGGYTAHCHYHGGPNELLPPGDPRRGGAPPTSFVYARVLRLPGDDEIIEASRGKLGTLDDEICVLRRNLYRALERAEAQPKGGVPTSVGAGGASVTVETHQGHVLKIQAELRKAELARAELIRSAGLTGSRGGPGELRWEFAKSREITIEDAMAESDKPDAG